jgi:hypothetical protein
MPNHRKRVPRDLVCIAKETRIPESIRLNLATKVSSVNGPLLEVEHAPDANHTTLAEGQPVGLPQRLATESGMLCENSRVVLCLPSSSSPIVRLRKLRSPAAKRAYIFNPASMLIADVLSNHSQGATQSVIRQS